jgi:hypothetical protein
VGRNCKNDTRKVSLETEEFNSIFRTDNAIKNHFYSTLRKLISRIQKDDIATEIRKLSMGYDNLCIRV